MRANVSTFFCYDMIISVQKLAQVIKSNTPIPRHSKEIQKKMLKRPLKQTWIDQKRFPD